jgi:hypothetical protein
MIDFPSRKTCPYVTLLTVGQFHEGWFAAAFRKKEQRRVDGLLDLQAARVTLRRLERFWIRAADLVQRSLLPAAVSSPPGQPFFA